MAQEFPIGPIIEEQFYGYDDTHPSELLPKGVFTKVENAFCSDRKMTKVFGSSSIAPSIAAKSFNGGAPYERAAIATKLVVVSINGASNAQLYTWGGSGSFAAIGSANLTNNTQMFFETANDVFYGFNGVEEVDYNGTTVSRNTAGIPLGTYPCWFHNYLFVAKTTAYPNRLYWSNLGDPTTFSGSNYIDVNPGDSDQIMGLGQLQDELLIFKQNTIWSITGWSGSSFSSSTINTQNMNARIFGYGSIAPGSIVSVGNDVYFLSFYGNVPHFRSLVKTRTANTLGGGIISTDIEITMKRINKGALSGITGAFDGRYVYWAIPVDGSSVNNYMVAFDTMNIAKMKASTTAGMTKYPWITMSGKNAQTLFISTITGNQTVMFTDSGTKGKVFKFDSSMYTDDGSNIAMDIRKTFMRDTSRKHKWKYMWVRYDVGVNSMLNVYAKNDQTATYGLQKAINLLGNSPGLGPTGTFTLNQSVLGGGTTNHQRITFQQLTGVTLDLQFTESSSSACTFYEYSLWTIPKGLRAS